MLTSLGSLTRAGHRSARRLLWPLTGLAVTCQLAIGQEIFRESFSTDGDGIRYTMVGRGSNTSPDAWEHTFALAQSATFPLGPGGDITLAANRIAIPWHSSIDNATADAVPFFDSAVNWATGGGESLNVSFLVKDGATSGSLDPGDAFAFNRLTADLGHTVNLFDADTAAPDVIGASDLLLVSDSVNFANIYRSLNIRDVQVPVVNYSLELSDDLLLTAGGGSYRELQSIDIRLPGSGALPGGFTQDQTVSLTDGKATLPEYGVPARGIGVMATYQGPFARSMQGLSTVDAMVDGSAASVQAVAFIVDADLNNSSSGNAAFNNPIPVPAGDLITVLPPEANPGNPSDLNNFAVVSRGTISVNQAGTYQFGLGGDDGGRLRINGQDVIVDDTFHGFTVRQAAIDLPAGDHEVEWVGFEGGGGSGWELSWASGDNPLEVLGVIPGVLELKDPGFEVTAYYLDPANSPDGPTNNPAILTAAAGTTFSFPSEPFAQPSGDYLLGTDMDSIPDTVNVPPGTVEFANISLSGVANPKLSFDVAATFGMGQDEGIVVLVNDQELAKITVNSIGIMVAEDSTGTRPLTTDFQTVTFDLPSGIDTANIRFEVSNNGSGEAIGIDEVRITDGNPADAKSLPVPENRIQQGLNGYTGVRDTEVRFSNADGDLSDKLSLNPDGSDGGGEVHGLTKFLNIFGDSENQIPLDANIESAVFGFNVTGPGTPLRLHRMLVDWEDDTATWNSFVNGIQADGTEAAMEADGQEIANAGNIEFDITETLRAWQVDPDSNFGWVILPTGTDGVDYLSAEVIDAFSAEDLLGLQVAPYIEYVLGTIDPTGCSPLNALAGDLDGDGTVGFPDFLALSANFGQVVDSYSAGDVDCSGDVGFPDFLALSANFGQSLSATAAVPEPNGFGLALVSLLQLVFVRRRR